MNHMLTGEGRGSWNAGARGQWRFHVGVGAGVPYSTPDFALARPVCSVGQNIELRESTFMWCILGVYLLTMKCSHFT